MATNYPVNVSLEDALNARLQGVPLANTYIDIDSTFTERNVYLQNKRSLGRMQYRDGQITCTTRGFNRSQVWKLSCPRNLPWEGVKDGGIQMEIGRRVLTIGENGNLQCEENRRGIQNWEFEAIQLGKYTLKVKGQVLCVGENGDINLKEVAAMSNDGGQLWTFVPANDCPFVRIVSVQTSGLLTMEEHGDVHAASHKFTDNQTWLIIPESYEQNNIFYMQNYQNGLKLAAVEDSCVKPPNRIVGVHDDVNGEQRWKLRRDNEVMRFVNTSTKTQLTARSHLDVGLGDIDDSWVLMPYKLQTMFVKFTKREVGKGPLLKCRGINVWSMERVNQYAYFLRDPRNGLKLACNAGHFFLTQEPKCANQFWYFEQIRINPYMYLLKYKEHDYVDVGICYITHAPFGLKNVPRYVYRVCRLNENISESITPSAPWSDRTLEQHEHSGAKYKSKFISTTADELHRRQRVFYDVDTDEKLPRPEPLRSVRIDLDLVKRDEQLAMWCINLGDKEVRDSFLLGSTHRNYATHTKEVIFMDQIPRAMYTITDPKNLVKPRRDDVDELGEGLELVNLNK